MDNSHLLVNSGKNEMVESDGSGYRCYAIKTKVVTDKDSLEEVVKTYAGPVLEKDDILFISEKMVACTQGRAIFLTSIKPGFLARFLSRFVMRSKHGIGLAMPETMQCALDECGVPRILLATFVSAVGKLFRQRGWFYNVAGYRAKGIDGPCPNTIPPYNKCVVLAPLEPDKTAAKLSKSLGGVTVLIVDVNDLGADILGSSSRSVDLKHVLRLLKQNPLGQSCESTPMGILRPVKK